MSAMLRSEPALLRQVQNRHFMSGILVGTSIAPTPTCKRRETRGLAHTVKTMTRVCGLKFSSTLGHRLSNGNQASEQPESLQAPPPASQRMHPSGFLQLLQAADATNGQGW